MKKKIAYCLFASVLSSVIYADVVPSSVDYVVRPLYGYRADGTPGRIVTVKLKGKELKGELSVDVIAKGKTEKNHFALNAKDSTEFFYLPQYLQCRSRKSPWFFVGRIRCISKKSVLCLCVIGMFICTTMLT